MTTTRSPQDVAADFARTITEAQVDQAAKAFPQGTDRFTVMFTTVAAAVREVTGCTASQAVAATRAHFENRARAFLGSDRFATVAEAIRQELAA